MEDPWSARDPHVGLLCCPVCAGPFTASAAAPGRTLRCEQGHAFDVARSGYVNLVPGGRRPIGPGDTPEMLAARRRFLEGGHFGPLSALTLRLVGEVLPPPSCEGCDGAGGEAGPWCVVEVGSGTGHHVAGLRASWTSWASSSSSRGLEGREGTGLCWFGFDVSKAACRLASSVHKAPRFVVADLRQGLPLRSGSALAVLDIFAPRDAAEFRRVLHPEGLALIVIPGPDHLGELVRRFGLIDVHPGKEQALLGDVTREGFRLVHREELRFGMELHPPEIADLVLMGPSARHLARGELEAGIGAAAMAVTASFVLLLLRPGPGQGQPGLPRRAQGLLPPLT